MKFVKVDPGELNARKSYFGWLVAARGKDFVYYSYRRDKFTWGDVRVRPSKRGGFIVSVSLSIDGKRFSEKKLAENFRDAYLLSKKFLKKYEWRK